MPKIGTIHPTHNNVRKILVGQPALAGLPSPRSVGALRWETFGVSSITVVAGKVMRWPPRP